jgi:hemolysin type calcium-binding protein
MQPSPWLGMRGPATRVGRLAAALVASLLLMVMLGAPTARAAVVFIDGGRLVFKADGDVDDIIDIRAPPRLPSAPISLAYEIYDGGDFIDPGYGCTLYPSRVVYCVSLLVTSIEVHGGGGDDQIGLWNVSVPVVAQGGEGDDLLESGSGADTLAGGPGVDGLVGAAGDDRLDGGEEDDLLSGGKANDTLEGGTGEDRLEAGSGTRNDLSGDDGRDLLLGGPGVDHLDGDAGGDALVGREAADTLNAGSGQDLIFARHHTPDKITCRGGDLVKGQPVAGCGTLPPSEGIPTVWPPEATSFEQAAQRPPAQAAQHVAPKVTAMIRRPGKPRRTTVTVSSDGWSKVTVNVRTFTRRGRHRKSFTKEVKTRKGPSISDPRPGRRAYYACARLHRKHNTRSRIGRTCERLWNNR